MPTRRQALAGTASLAALSTLRALPAAAADDEVARHFDDILFGDQSDIARPLGALAARGGADLAAGLILALRFVHWSDGPIRETLARVTGERGPRTWFEWMLWQEAHPDIVPHPSYADLMRRVHLRIDPEFDVFLAPERLRPEAMRIRLEEIAWGGVRKDGIPSLDRPKMIPAGEADYLVGSDLVFGIAIDGDVRAYPLRIMGWHEMFNDVIGGVPLALAYCTLCGAGILFETDVGGRAPFVFGSSGFLYRSNKLMFDRETQSLWNQFTGRPVVGPLVGSGIELRQRPVVIEPWVRWAERHPESTVLSLDTGHVRNYGSGVVYDHYFSSPELMFPARVDERRLAQKDYVFGIRTFGAAKAWPLSAFEGGRVINDSVGGLNVVLVGDRLGRTVRAYDRGARVFGPGAAPGTLREGQAAWRVTEEHLAGPGGARAPRVAGHVAYWFAWDGYLGAGAELHGG